MARRDYGTHRGEFDRNKAKVFKRDDVCSICGRPVDKSLKFPHPLSATVDHIVPINRGGHPSDINNLALAHFTCNRQKSDKLMNISMKNAEENVVSNRILPQSVNWSEYRQNA